jgi:hypothetical protein
MKSIGLQPSSTGAVGGKETGQRMSDYIIPDGPFVHAFAKLAATGWALNLQSAPRPGGTKVPNHSKTTFTCPSGGRNVSGKPDTAVFCSRARLQRASRSSCAPRREPFNRTNKLLNDAGKGEAARCRTVAKFIAGTRSAVRADGWSLLDLLWVGV